MVLAVLRVGFCAPTVISVALVSIVVLTGVGRVFTLTDVGRPSFSYRGSCFPCRPGIVPSGSDVVPGLWRLLLVVWIL